jgi:NAD-dependent dihydropyrimidine dehydrogenase PreA subunit
MSMQPTLMESLKEHLRLAKGLRNLRIIFSPEKCTGVWQCYEVCPTGCWTPDYVQDIAIFQDEGRCIACGACVLQCPEEAIELR